MAMMRVKEMVKNWLQKISKRASRLNPSLQTALVLTLCGEVERTSRDPVESPREGVRPEAGEPQASSTGGIPKGCLQRRLAGGGTRVAAGERVSNKVTWGAHPAGSPSWSQVKGNPLQGHPSKLHCQRAGTKSHLQGKGETAEGTSYF